MKIRATKAKQALLQVAQIRGGEGHYDAQERARILTPRVLGQNGGIGPTRLGNSRDSALQLALIGTLTRSTLRYVRSVRFGFKSSSKLRGK
jgi:hypothetical protein